MSFKGHRNVTKPDGSTPDGWSQYVCGHCGTKVSGAVIATYNWNRTQHTIARNKWLLCPNCSLGSVKIDSMIFPGSPFGPTLEGLPIDVQESYEETRRCMEVNAFTAAELICRKILMHVAVETGAKEGESFAASFNY